MTTLTTLDRRGEYLTVAEVAAELACSGANRPTPDQSWGAAGRAARRARLRCAVPHDALVAWLWAAPTEDSN